MALSMDEERMLAEIERRLADDDPVLASRLTSFRLPRLSLAPRSARARLTASLLMLVVVAAVSVFVYALMPFRGQGPGNSGARTGTPAAPTLSASSPAGSQAEIRPVGYSPRAPSVLPGSASIRPGTSGSAGSGK